MLEGMLKPFGLSLNLKCSNNTKSGFPGDSVVKNPPAKAGDTGSVPGLGRSLEEETENSMDIGAWWATVQGVAESDMS